MICPAGSCRGEASAQWSAQHADVPGAGAGCCEASHAEGARVDIRTGTNLLVFNMLMIDVFNTL